jgi:hypothetical protein
MMTLCRNDSLMMDRLEISNVASLPNFLKITVKIKYYTIYSHRNKQARLCRIRDVVRT